MIINEANTMNNPLDNVPLNTNRQFVMGVAKCGCEIYVPVEFTNILAQNVRQKMLQEYLDSDVFSDVTIPPPTAA